MTRIKRIIIALAVITLLTAMPIVAFADAAYNLATAVGKTTLQVIPGGAGAIGEIYFYNVDGSLTTYITMETIDAPEGWTVEFIPALSTITVNGNPVTQHIFVEPTAVFTEETPAPSGMYPLPLPDRFGPGTMGYTWAKRMWVKVTVPESAAINLSEPVEVNAKAAYLGQTGAVTIGQERPFTFTINTVTEITDERISIPFDWNRWLPVIIAGGIGLVVVGVVYVPRLIAKRRKSA